MIEAIEQQGRDMTIEESSRPVEQERRRLTRRSRRLAVGVVTGALVTVMACGGSGGSPTSPSSSTPTTRVISISGSLAFGSVLVGESRALSFTIANTGTSPLTVTSVQGPDSFVPQSTVSWFQGTIGAGGSQVVTVTFRPTSAGNHSGVLTVVADQTSGANTISVSAQGSIPTPPPIGTYNWAARGGLEFCSGSLCLDFNGTLTNNGTGCATSVVVHVEFYTQEFSPFLADPLVFPVDAQVSGIVRPGQPVSFRTGTVFTNGRHIIDWKASVKYTPVSC
jgi:hypothetical protein